MSGRESLASTDPAGHFELTSESDWEDVQSQYRHLVQRWHPDRHPPASRDRAQAKFIEITTAFKRLRRHYGEHGRLPRPESTSSVPRRASDATRAVPGSVSPDFPTPTRPPSARTARLRAILRSPLTAVAAALAIGLALVTFVVVLDGRLAAERREQALSRAAEKADEAREASERGEGWEMPRR